MIVDGARGRALLFPSHLVDDLTLPHHAVLFASDLFDGLGIGVKRLRLLLESDLFPLCLADRFLQRGDLRIEPEPLDDPLVAEHDEGEDRNDDEQADDHAFFLQRPRKSRHEIGPRPLLPVVRIVHRLNVQEIVDNSNLVPIRLRLEGGAKFLPFPVC